MNFFIVHVSIRRIPGDLQQVVFNVAAQSSEHWMSLLDMYTRVTYDAEKRKMLLGLASTQDVRRIVWYVLQFASIQDQTWGMKGFIFPLTFLANLLVMLLMCWEKIEMFNRNLH